MSSRNRADRRLPLQNEVAQNEAIKGCRNGNGQGSGARLLPGEGTGTVHEKTAVLPILSVADLNVLFRGNPVLENISFDVKRGVTVAIVGPNGAGKTTLFRALLNLVRYTGKVEWGKGVKMGYVPQGLIATDMPISAGEFLAFKCRTDVGKCLNMVGLGPSILGKQLGSLSGGELQRVLLAWAIVDYPDILLFDEPTTGIDIGAEEPIYNHVRELKETLGLTILLISHNLHVVTHYSDMVLGINRKVLYYGSSGSISHSQLIGLMMGSGLTEGRAEFDHSEEGLP